MTDKFKQDKQKLTKKDTCTDFNKLKKKQNPIKPSLLSMIELEINEKNKGFR